MGILDGTGIPKAHVYQIIDFLQYMEEEGRGS